jgi:hypothetical protein
MVPGRYFSNAPWRVGLGGCRLTAVNVVIRSGIESTLEQVRNLEESETDTESESEYVFF